MGLNINCLQMQPRTYFYDKSVKCILRFIRTLVDFDGHLYVSILIMKQIQLGNVFFFCKLDWPEER